MEVDKEEEIADPQVEKAELEKEAKHMSKEELEHQFMLSYLKSKKDPDH